MDLYEIRQLLDKIEQDFKLLISDQDIKYHQDIIKAIDEEMLDSDFYSDQNHVKERTAILSRSKTIVSSQIKIETLLSDTKEFLEIYLEEEDQDLFKELVHELKQLDNSYQELETMLLLSEEYDKNDAIVEIHCGAGGTESQDWVEMLYKMYLGYVKHKGFKVDLLDISMASDVGIKSLTMRVQGIYAYGLLKSEKGVHRLVRISPFDSNDRRHTTFALVSISPALDEIKGISIDESDLEIDTYRSSGAGGQSVNTTDSAVRIVHKPTKIVVTCQNQRSQHQNKEEALNVLKSKLLELELEKQREKSAQLKDSNIDVNFGSQIRSYVFHPYSMVKDHRSNFETSDVDGVMSGKIDELI
ncbi:MAG: peptide chain release factor 2, partial [Coprobacillus sp.]